MCLKTFLDGVASCAVCV